MSVPSPCLSENTISELLSSGEGTEAALGRALSHAAECATCRKLLAAATRAAVSSSGQTSAPADGSRVFPPALLPRGAQIGRYIVLDLCGAGGMGVVYAAYDPSLDRKVALKLLRPQSSDSAVAAGTAALLREAQALARLRHPCIVSVYDVDSDPVLGQVFIAMELLNGQTAAEWLAQTPRSLDAILTLFEQAGQGLWAAHQSGITHRDFKPSKVTSVEKLRTFVRTSSLMLRTRQAWLHPAWSGKWLRG